MARPGYGEPSSLTDGNNTGEGIAATADPHLPPHQQTLQHRVCIATESNQSRSAITQGGSAISQARPLGIQQDSFGDLSPLLEDSAMQVLGLEFGAGGSGDAGGCRSF